MSQTHEPQRMCIGCRKVAPKRDLVRLVVSRLSEPPAVEIDLRGSAPGRGAWVHEHPDCVTRAQAKGITRALRIAEYVDMTKVTTWSESIRQ